MAVPPDDTLLSDEAAIARHIPELTSNDASVREAAAAALRAIVAKYPGGTTNIRDTDAGKAAWQAKIAQTHLGMTEAEVETILPPIKGEHGWELGSGQSHNKLWRLDDHWMFSAAYLDSGGLLSVPELHRCERRARMAWPPHFTGRWTTWYVNGQKADESELRDGKYDGTLTNFYDNGRKCYEQHFVAGVAEGTDTGWYPSGKPSYKGQYTHDQQNGVWIHWYENGQKQTETHYKNGKNHGLDATWYENGQIKLKRNYRDGIEDGVDAAWDKNGVLQYNHQMKNGNVVE